MAIKKARKKTATKKTDGLGLTYITRMDHGNTHGWWVRVYKDSKPGESKLIPTGLRFAIPHGYEIQVRPRSGLALRHQITVLNTPGTIDSDYRGEVGIILINHVKEPFTITPQMRIAPIILAPVCRAHFLREEILISSARGEGGFGHSGSH